MHVYITIWKGERGTGEPWGYYCRPWPGPPGSWPVERLRCIRHVWEAINKKESLLLANTPILAWCSILQTCISHNFSLILHIFGQVWSVPYKLGLPQEQRCTLLLARVELLRDWQNQIQTGLYYETIEIDPLTIRQKGEKIGGDYYSAQKIGGKSAKTTKFRGNSALIIKI